MRNIMHVRHHSCVQGVGLCHGVSGNAYAFLSLFRATGDELHLARAQRLGLAAALTWRDVYSRPDRPASLFEVRAAGWDAQVLLVRAAGWGAPVLLGGACVRGEEG